jgi:hypothetical protein
VKPLKSSARSIVTKLGSAQTVNMDTGEVISEQQNAMTLLPPSPDVCQMCAVDHPHDQPHNQQSMHWQYWFFARHRRWPMWTDAMAHCTEEVKRYWRKELVGLMTVTGETVPEDLLEPKPQGR